MNHTRSIDTRAGRIEYKYRGIFARDSELKVVDGFVRAAFNMAHFVVGKLGEGGGKTLEFAQAVYGDIGDDGLKEIAARYEAVISRLKSGICVCRDGVFADSDGGEDSSVMASADVEDGKTITIYDSFFKKAEGDEKGLNARSSIILHETAHLLGMDSDEESGNLDSAECLRNFTLLVCEIVKLEDLEDSLNPTCEAKAESEDSESQPEENSSESEGKNPDAPQNEDGFGEKELPYSPDQPRAPKGQSDGGRWVGGGNRSCNSSSKNVDSQRNNSTDKFLQEKKRSGIFDKGEKNVEEKSAEFANAKFSSKTVGEGLGVKNGKYTNEIWGAITEHVEGLPKNKSLTFAYEIDVKEIDKDGNDTNILEGEPLRNLNSSWAYDINSADGNVEIKDVGIFNQNASNKVDVYNGGTIEGELTLRIYEGSVADNFGSVDKVPFNGDNSAQELSTSEAGMQGEYGYGAYGAAHAGTGHGVSEKNKASGYIGGGVNGRKAKDDPVLIKKYKIHINPYTSEKYIKDEAGKTLPSGEDRIRPKYQK